MDFYSRKTFLISTTNNKSVIMGTLSMQNHFYKLKNNAVMRRLSFSSLPESYYPSIAKMLQLHYIEVSNALAQLVDYYSYFLEMSIDWTSKIYMLAYILRN